MSQIGNTYDDGVQVVQVARVRVFERHELAHVQVVQWVCHHILHLVHLAGHRSWARRERAIFVKNLGLRARYAYLLGDHFKSF